VSAPHSYKNAAFRVVPKYNYRAETAISSLGRDASADKLSHLRAQAKQESEMNRRQSKKMQGEPVRYGQVREAIFQMSSYAGMLSSKWALLCSIR